MFIEQKIAFCIWNVFSSFLLIFGTFGNVLTIIVLMQRKNRGSNIAKYLTGLAVCDLFVLWTAVPRNWLHFGYGIDLRSASPLICRVQLYLNHVSVYSSNSFIVILTIERWICTWLPMKVKSICTTRNAKIVISIMLAFFFSLNAHFLYGMGHKEKNICYPVDDSYAYFYFNVWPLIRIATAVIQITLLMVVNISIIIRVLIVRRKTHKQAIPRALTTAARERKAQNGRLTVMLITLNVVFMICVIPIMVFLTLHSDWVLDFVSNGNDHSDAVMELIWAIVNALFYTNNAVNFILYFLSGSTFREQVTEILSPILHSWRAVCRCVNSSKNIVHPRLSEVNVEQ